MKKPIRKAGYKEPGMLTVRVRTYIYVNDDGQLVHQNAVMGMFGTEYVHETEDTLPLYQEDWPYEIVDLRKE